MKFRYVYLTLFFTSIFLLAFSMHKKKYTEAEQPKDEYSKLWEAVSLAEKEVKTTDAQKIVDQIFILSKKENNVPQTIKAILYKGKYLNILKENSKLEIVNLLKTEIDRSIGEEKAIFQSLLAEIYTMYYSQNQYKFSERTAVSGESIKEDDFRSWDLNTLNDEISRLYMASVADKNLLLNVPLKSYVDILQNVSEESLLYHPSLYDFLVNRAISFFSEKPVMLEEPANAFKLDKQEYLQDAKTFYSIDLSQTRQLKNNLYFATSLYQELLRHRSEAPQRDAYLSAELNRLLFVKENFTGKGNEIRFRESLQQIIDKHAGFPTTAMLYYELCRSLKDEIADEDKNDITHAQILALCDKVIKEYSGTKGAQNCELVRNEILRKDLQIQVERYIIPGEPTKALIQYRNVNTIYFNLVKVDDYEAIYSISKNEDRIKKLNSLSSVKKWSVELPNKGDYRLHSVETPLISLPYGNYVLMVSDNKEFSIEKNAVATAPLSATSISYILKPRSYGESLDLYVLNRKSGLPISGASVKAMNWKYDYDQRKNVKQIIGTYTTDDNGHAVINSTSDGYYLFFEIKHGKETLNTNHSHYWYKGYLSDPSPYNTTHFFTDRSIYRPGQTVYFKGVITRFDNVESKSLAGQTSTIYLRDVNYEEVSSIEVTTNEFGTFSGSFILPLSGLTGAFTLENESGSKSIQVEEYKRPTFEVKVEKPQENLKLEQKVTLKGNAKTYFGAPVTDAAVTYRVVRKVHFPYPRRHFWWIPFPTGADKEITYGEAITDKEGNFSITFEAIPDKSIEKSLKPVFTYEVTANVTDLAGETRSASQNVRLGYVSLMAEVTTPERWIINESNSVVVKTTNLDGIETDAEVKISVSKLKAPETLKNQKYWSRPDVFLMTEEEHRKLFLYDEYADENNPMSWDKDSEIFSEMFSTGKKNKLDFNAHAFSEPGVYRIDLLCDQTAPFPIEITKFIRVDEKDAKVPVYPETLKLYSDKPLKPGDKKLEYKLASSFKQVTVLIEVYYDGKPLEKRLTSLNREIKTFSYDLKPDQKGKIEIQASMVYQNRHYTQSLSIEIPEPSKELQIEWITFRDKLDPGKKETWKLKIKGPKGDQVAAELLATMYDASLDAFLGHDFNFSLPQLYLRSADRWRQDNFNSINGTLYEKDWNKYLSYQYMMYPGLNLFGFYLSGYYYKSFNSRMMAGSPAMAEMSMQLKSANAKEEAISDAETELYNIADDKADASSNETVKTVDKSTSDEPQPLRTNLQETAFFFPELTTDKEGNVVLEFTTPESLTRWKILGFALDKNLNHALIKKETVTQKDVMILPHLPRFLRERDEITLTAKIFNLTDENIVAKTSIKLMDALTGKDVTQALIRDAVIQNIPVNASGNGVVAWKVNIPDGLQAANYEIFTTSGNKSDGEGGFLPVLTNRMLVTESLPLQVLGNQTKNYVFEKLKNNSSYTLKHHELTLEITENPVWYAIQALPYLMEYPYECAEQTFNRLYANSIAGHVVQSNPAIKKTFDLWKNLPDSKALLSNLEKNQELKMLLIEETPWLRSAENETEQKKRIALLFDLNKMNSELNRAMSRIMQMQTPNGGFSWFPGMRDSRYITQYIVAGYAHLINLGIGSIQENTDLRQVMGKAVLYLDNRIEEDFKEIKKQKDYLKEDNLGYYHIQYLYARSYFPDIKLKKNTQEAHTYFKNQAKTFWKSRNEQLKAMIAITLNKSNERETALSIIESLRQNALNSEEMGMYWKAVDAGGYYWYNARIETQAILIEAFDEVDAKQNEINAMKLWLLKQKQVQQWPTTKATAEACYALLLKGSDWLSEQRQVEVSLGSQKINSATVTSKEPGTGYFKVKWEGEKVNKEMANVQIKGKGEGVSWGAVYWQYFEDLDKITPAETPLVLTKELYKEVQTNEGIKLIKVDEKSPLKVGDKVKVRIILKTDRNMEFVHLKDMRSAGFEPINVLSSYKWQDGLGYYESTRDAATNFFIDYLPKGIYVFEYPLRVSHKGDFSNGITSVQSMYAPEFTAHSQGVRVKVE